MQSDIHNRTIRRRRKGFVTGKERGSSGDQAGDRSRGPTVAPRGGRSRTIGACAFGCEAGPRPGVRLDRDGGCPPGRRLSYSDVAHVRRPSTANRLSELDRMLMRTYHNGVRPQARPPDTVTSHIECITTSACNQGHDQGPAVHHPVCVLSAACTQVTACSCTVSSPWECGLQSYGRSV